VERAFREAAGFTKANDCVPEFIKYEKLSLHDVVWVSPRYFGEARLSGLLGS